MRVRGVRRSLSMIAVVLLAGMGGGAGAQMMNAPQLKAPHSPIPARVRPAGLWDRPNEACMNKCRVYARKGCFTQLSKKNPAADPSEIQDKCDDKYSLCLYDCMCDTCDEDQIKIRP
ncbi:hypothetical protein BMS3Bbin10_01511 [bacterium BMS3Bbin10]|nr:hypothetical protein BMS3Bbin10_01511 [bacterium BMS3Bbin10]